MANFRELVLAHPGRTFGILGGGPSLPEQLETLPPDAVLISCNQHGCMLTLCDYIVALDVGIQPELREHGRPIISPQVGADYRISEHPRLDYTGQQAAWVAWLMGGHPIVLCGMDLYQTGTWWHDPKADCSAYQRPYDSHFSTWQRGARVVPATIRAAGGPLVEIFGAWDPADQFPVFVPPERSVLLAACAGVIVEIRQYTRLHRCEYFIGQTVELPRADAQRLILQRKARLAETADARR